MKLPNAERVRIDERKVRDYLLSKTHPIGRFKARVFGAIGFDESNRAAFMAALQRIAKSGEISQVEEIPFGRKYTVPGELEGPAGVILVQTVWLQGPGEPDVRLVTVRPR